MTAQDPFEPIQDFDEIQAIILAGAIQGDEACRVRLASLANNMEDPYRNVASVLLEQTVDGGFADQRTVRAAMQGMRLVRCRANGSIEDLAADQVLNLICDRELQPGQACSYLDVFDQQVNAKRRVEFKETVLALGHQFGEDPTRLISELERLTTQVRRDADRVYPSEVLNFFPYFQRLIQIQTGASFQGLDSGFKHLNDVANGLDTGLFVLAARPSAGKTTFVWQICQQVAELNRIPVIFVSMEQSAVELRAKSLARLARLNTRHVSRGRLRSDNPEDLQKLQQAAEKYFTFSPFLTIVQGDDLTTIDRIGDIARAKMVRAGVSRCLVAVDYLQIMPLDRGDGSRVTSSKDRVDLHVSQLRRLARQLDSPIIAISSENRAGYTSKELDVFKESGGIEYSADIAGIMTVDTQATNAAQGRFRMLDLNVVKNRNGEVATVKYKFYPEWAEFIESGKEKLQSSSEN